MVWVLGGTWFRSRILVFQVVYGQKIIWCKVNGFVWDHTKRILKNINWFWLQLLHKFGTLATKRLNQVRAWRAKIGIPEWHYRPQNYLLQSRWDPLRASSKDSGLYARSLSPAAEQICDILVTHFQDLSWDLHSQPVPILAARHRLLFVFFAF